MSSKPDRLKWKRERLALLKTLSKKTTYFNPTIRKLEKELSDAETGHKTVDPRTLEEIEQERVERNERQARQLKEYQEREARRRIGGNDIGGTLEEPAKPQGKKGTSRRRKGSDLPGT